MTTDTKNPPITLLAKIISGIFHPLLMPLYGLLVIFSAPTLYGFLPSGYKKLLLIIICVNNILLPLLLILYLWYRKLIASLVIDNRNERVLPLIMTTFFYFITLYILIKFRIPVFIKSYILSAAIISLAVMIINMKFMISIHGAGAGALLALVLILSFRMHMPLTLFLMASVIICALVISARLWLNSHSPSEAWWGLFLGFTVTALLLSVF
jgi:hypothetical protein